MTPQDGKQGWVGAGGVLASSCTVVNGFTGQCGSAAGDAVTIANCAGSGSGPQYFDVYRA
ncbi:hypothetical protein B0H14DRAFT_3489368 [Mycena olivaceomarginata]|nr:hypothetical protein B0H14DRAFT_3489368 [Mycena olivaceomarginata]